MMTSLGQHLWILNHVKRRPVGFHSVVPLWLHSGSYFLIFEMPHPLDDYSAVCRPVRAFLHARPSLVQTGVKAVHWHPGRLILGGVMESFHSLV